MDEDKIVQRFLQFLIASADCYDMGFTYTTDRLLEDQIRRGVRKMTANKSSVSYGEILQAQTSLLQLVLAMVKEFHEPDGSIRSLNEELILEAWKKRCPGCPPWC